MKKNTKIDQKLVKLRFSARAKALSLLKALQLFMPFDITEDGVHVYITCSKDLQKVRGKKGGKNSGEKKSNCSHVSG